jgi:hypothetical protein
MVIYINPKFHMVTQSFMLLSILNTAYTQHPSAENHFDYTAQRTQRAASCGGFRHGITLEAGHFLLSTSRFLLHFTVYLH